MDAIQEFDSKFRELYTKLVEIAFEYVNRNSEEVDEVYIIGSIESGYFYKAFYKINGTLVKFHKINTVSTMQYDINKDRAFALLKLGNTYLAEIETLFKEYDREVPTLLKLVYLPKTGEFDSKFEYGLKFTNHKTKTPQDLYEEWYDELDK